MMRGFVDRKSVLLLNYHFPPLGGSGVQRALKFAKYLPQAGWDTVVVVAKNTNYLVYDYSLLKEIPPAVEVIRTESLDPLRLSVFMVSRSVTKASESEGVVRNPKVTEGSKSLSAYRRIRDFVGIPDIWIGWVPFAVAAGWKAIRRKKIDAIVGMLGPGSTAVIARLLSACTGTPYVLDLRDGWTEDPYRTYPSRLHKWVNEAFEKWTMSKASALTVHGDWWRERFERKYPWLAGKITVIHNGFDRADMGEAAPLARTGAKRRIVYMGSLNFYHEAAFLAFLDAMQRLPSDLRNKLEIVFVGRAYERAPRQAEDAGLKEIISFVPYCKHGEALGYLQSADAALLFVAAGDTRSISGKVFEYLMIGQPILAFIEPASATADLLTAAGHDRWIAPPDKPGRIADTIVALDAAGWPVPDGSRVEQFGRQRGAERLAGVLDSVTRKCNEHTLAISG
jgi:glycosyltransferase involved in cell wall biosynthesis